jgi:hypothetical protein
MVVNDLVKSPAVNSAVPAMRTPMPRDIRLIRRIVLCIALVS